MRNNIILQPALRGWFVYKVSRSAIFTILRKLVFLLFYRLSNLKFDSCRELD